MTTRPGGETAASGPRPPGKDTSGIPHASPMAVLDGAGIHTGASCRVEFTLRPGAGGGFPGRALPGSGLARPGAVFPGDSSGVCFRLPDAVTGRVRSLAPAELAGMTRAARRATVLGEGGEALHTPEHLLAALLFFADAPLDVLCLGAEVPNLDGSALPFREALAELLPDRARAPAWREYPSRLRWDHAWEGGWIRVRPSTRFAVTYTWEACGLSETVRVDSPGQAWHGILPARTWITHREWLAGRAAGLLRGAEEGAGLLLAETAEEHACLVRAHPGWDGAFPLLSPGAWRLPAEPARHKVLDLFGDLALLDLALPSVEVGIRNGGHHVNHLLLERLTHG